MVCYFSVYMYWSVLCVCDQRSVLEKSCCLGWIFTFHLRLTRLLLSNRSLHSWEKASFWCACDVLPLSLELRSSRPGAEEHYLCSFLCGRHVQQDKRTRDECSLTVSDLRLASTHSLWASRLETAQTRVWCRVLSVLQLLWEDALPLNKQNKQKRSMRLHFWKELFIFSRAVYANWICAGRLESFWCKHMLYTSLLCLNCVSVLYEDFQHIAVFITVLGTLAVLLMLCMWL